MTKKRTKKKKPSKSLIDLQNVIKKYSTLVSLPNNETTLFSHKKSLNGSDIDCNTFICPNIFSPNNKLQFETLKPTEDSLCRTTRYNLYPTEEQKTLMLGFCEAYIDMYNIVVKHIKQKRLEEIINSNNSNLRYCDLTYKPKRNYLKKLFTPNKKYLSTKYKINMHILDAAIMDALAMLKSIISNQRNGHIKNAKFRCLKKTKPKRIFKVEKQICSDNSFCSSIIGKTIKIVPELNFVKDCKKIHIIQYDLKKDKFYLLKRDPVKQMTLQVPYKVIAIDPGEKTLITGISENHILELGTKISPKINAYLRKIIMIKKHKKNNSRIIKKINKVQQKINNYVTDTQWKISNYLTDNYDHILIGNLSTSRMKKHEKVNNLDILKNLNMYKLRSKIKYKCLLKNKKFKIINEAYTTKCCIHCGKINEVGLSRTYKCVDCDVTNGRDIKAAGCIYLKGLQ